MFFGHNAMTLEINSKSSINGKSHHVYNISVETKLDYKFNIITIKTPTGIFFFAVPQVD